MDDQALLQRLTRMLRSRTVPVTLTDAEGRVLFANEAALTLTGRTLEEVRGNRASHYFAAEDQERVRQVGEQVAQSGDAVEVDYVRVQHPDGTTRPIAMVVASVPGAKGDHIGKLAVAVDLTERERLTERLRAAHSQLRYYTDLTAHDIRNYTQTVSGYLEALLTGQMGPLSSEQKRVLRVCQRQTRRTRRLLAQVDLLLESEARRAAGQAPTLAPKSLSTLVAQAVSEVLEDFQDRTPAVVVQVDPGATVLVCDKFSHALEGLVRDCVEHNPRPDPELRITAFPDRLRGLPAWRLHIDDNGPGLPEEVREALIRDSQEQRRPASGVGFRLAVAILQRCGGTLRIDGHRIGPHPEDAARTDAEAVRIGLPSWPPPEAEDASMEAPEDGRHAAQTESGSTEDRAAAGTHIRLSVRAILPAPSEAQSEPGEPRP